MTNDPDRSGDRRELVVVFRRRARRAGRTVFGDRLGLVIFLAGLTFVTAYWRIGVFITDSYAIANTLVNVADGHLAITRIEYSINYDTQPGLWVTDGQIYGRNYGHAYLSLPVLWLLDVLSLAFDPRLVLAGGWSLLVVVLAEQVGRIRNARRRWVIAGCALGLGAFLVSTLFASPLADRWFPFVALQLTTMATAAFVGVGLYRLLDHLHTRRLGAVAGLAVVVGTPVGFWASLPKRHVFSALTVIVVLAGFYFARTLDSTRRSLAARTLPYVAVALLAWIHPLEALAIFGVFVPLDLLTAPSYRPRTLAVVAVVFLIALGPFVATNYAIAGNPLEPPRSLDPFRGQVDPGSDRTGDGGATPPESDRQPGTPTSDPKSTETGESSEPATPPPTDGSGEGAKTGQNDGRGPSTTSGGASSNGADSGDGEGWSPLAPLVGLVVTLLGFAVAVLDGAVLALERGWDFFREGVTLLTAESDRLYHTFVRSGRIPEYVDYEINQQEAIDLTVLETGPLLGGVVGAVAVALRRAANVSSLGSIRRDLGRPARQTDLLAVAIVAVFVVVNLSRLPINTQITVRYLLPIFPVGLYALARLPGVECVVDGAGRWLTGTYTVTVVTGALALLAGHWWLDPAVGEAMQLHALLALASVVPLAGWSLVVGFRPALDDRVGAVALAVPAALTTLFLLFTGFAYFRYAEYALTLARLLADWLPVAL